MVVVRLSQDLSGDKKHLTHQWLVQPRTVLELLYRKHYKSCLADISTHCSETLQAVFEVWAQTSHKSLSSFMRRLSPEEFHLLEIQDQADVVGYLTPIEYARLRKMAAQMVYYYIRTK